jgi:hypothetical protein
MLSVQLTELLLSCGLKGGGEMVSIDVLLQK